MVGNRKNTVKGFAEPLIELNEKEIDELAEILRNEYGIEPPTAAKKNKTDQVNTKDLLKELIAKAKQHIQNREHADSDLSNDTLYKSNADEIVESLIQVHFAKFEKAAIARRIALLTEMQSDNFEFSEDYEDEEQILFQQFKSLSPEKRSETLDKLTVKLSLASL